VTGTVNVSGFGTTPLRFSNITTTAADGDIVVGNASGSIGELNIFNGGIVGAADDVQVGPASGSNGIVDVGGASGGGHAQRRRGPAGRKQHVVDQRRLGTGERAQRRTGSMSPASSAWATPRSARARFPAATGARSTPVRSSATATGDFSTSWGARPGSTAARSRRPEASSPSRVRAGETPFLRLLNGASCSLGRSDPRRSAR
jgi:hypothetical protein